MAKYYYCPLYLAPSMRQPGARPTLSSYVPGFFNAATGVYTSAVAALVAAGVDLDTYSVYNGYTSDPVAEPQGCRLTGSQPKFQSNGGILTAGNQQPNSTINAPGQFTTSFKDGPWPGPVNSGAGIGETIAIDGASGPTGQESLRQRPGWARTAILYIDTTRRMVIQTPDNFADAPFLSLGWVEKTVEEVNADYPLTIQYAPVVGGGGVGAGQQTRPRFP